MRTFTIFLCFIGSLQMAQARLYINEIMASNVLSHVNSEGEYEDWIEIYNSGTSSVNIAGYFLTDNYRAGNYWKIPNTSPSKTTVPPNGFLLFYADGKTEQGPTHLPFQLAKEGEEVALISPDGRTIIDSLRYGFQYRDISYGRMPDGGNAKGYFETPTPGASNVQGYSGVAGIPQILTSSGFYSGNVLVTVQASELLDTLRYTLDGSDPVRTSSRYSGPLSLSSTKVFKVKSFGLNKMPSPIQVHTYFVNTEHTLPVLSLSTDPENLFNPQTGIYVNNNKEGRAWERPVELEWFENHKLGFQTGAGTRIQGNTGPRDYDKKSFRIYFREGYGRGRLNYPLFPNDTVSTFNTLVLRSGYDDNLEPKNPSGTLIRDPLVFELWRRAGQIGVSGRFSVLYLNGQFHGIYEIKESMDEDFVRTHLRLEAFDLMRTRWDSTELVYGSRDEWKKLVQFFESNTFSSDAMLEQANARLDLENFTTLMALVHATEWKSWAYGTFMIRAKFPTAKWIWTIWDADRAFTELEWNGLTDPYSPLASTFDNLFIKKLLQNATYKKYYINRIMDLLNTVFSPSQVEAIIDSLANQIASEIPLEVAKWQNTVSQWNQNIQGLKYFAKQRPGIVIQQLQEYFQLRNPVSIVINAGFEGKIQVNTVTISTFPWTGRYFEGIPITLKAIPNPGYRFLGWSNGSSNPEIQVNPTQDFSIEAQFEPLTETNVEILSPSRFYPGAHIPMVIRIRDFQWKVDWNASEDVQVKWNMQDTLIHLKKGVGTGIFNLTENQNVTFEIENSKIPKTSKTVQAYTSWLTVEHTGPFSVTQVTWDASVRHVVKGILQVPPNCQLTILPGTWIEFEKNARLEIQGTLQANGTPSDPVVFISRDWNEPWGGLEFKKSKSTFQYCFFVNGGGDPNRGTPAGDGWHTGRQHILFAYDDTELILDNVFILNSFGKAIGAQDSKVTVNNSVTAFVWHGGEFHRVWLRYQNSHLLNIPNDDHIYTEDIDTDGFHIDYVNPKYPFYSELDHLVIMTTKDDAIDHHYARLRITHCWLEDIIHEGVAASGGDTLRIFDTVAKNCDQGFEVGWTESGIAKGPIMYLDHSVAIDNNVGLRIGDSYAWSYRGELHATNVVLYNNKDNIWNYLNSTHGPLEGAIHISYSMTNDSEYDASPYCITGTPLFDENYYLLPNSPGAGMGMYGTNMGRADSTAIQIGPVVIHEIMYNAPPDLPCGDWIELYNPQSVDQDISHWILKDDNDAHAFQFASGTVIPAGQWLVVCEDLVAFQNVYPNVPLMLGNLSFGLGRNDAVRLYSKIGMLVDSVDYDNNAPWPTQADGNGFSLELLSISLDNARPESWASSLIYGGTPGKGNRLTKVETKSRAAHPEYLILEQNYPNPFNPFTEIRYTLPRPAKVKLIVYDVQGKKVTEWTDETYKPKGQYTITLSSFSLTSGVYFYQIQVLYQDHTREQKTKKMVVIR